MKDKIFSVGDLAVSKMGHDKGRIYIVAAVVSPEFLQLCDGKIRPLDKLKVKRVKHLVPLGQSGLTQQFLDKSVTNAEIIFAVKQYISKA